MDPAVPSSEVGLGYHLRYFGGLSTFSDSVWIQRARV